MVDLTTVVMRTMTAKSDFPSPFIYPESRDSLSRYRVRGWARTNPSPSFRSIRLPDVDVDALPVVCRVAYGQRLRVATVAGTLRAPQDVGPCDD